ncbi:hypothetical protein TNCV_2442461 [Trichonephila clavipes]|nr:hypothetical protein TNCV_2442461 [Trichonephila clavipes]
MWSGIILLKKGQRTVEGTVAKQFLPLCCKWASNDDQRGPAAKRIGTPDRNFWLRVCVACNSENGMIGTLPRVFEDRQDTVGSGIRRKTLYVPFSMIPT